MIAPRRCVNRVVLRRSRALVALSASFGVGVLVGPAGAAGAVQCGQPSSTCIWTLPSYYGVQNYFTNQNATWLSTLAVKNDDSSWSNNGSSGRRFRVFRSGNYGGNTGTAIWTICISQGVDLASSAYGNDGESNDWPTSCANNNPNGRPTTWAGA